MSKIEHAANSVDQDIAAGDQRVDRSQDEDVYEKLQCERLSAGHPCFQAAGANEGFVPLLAKRDEALLHVVGLPVLNARDLAAVPLVDAVIEMRPEVVVLVPFDWSAAQALGVDLEIFHCRSDLGSVCWPTSAFECRLDRHPSNPAFRHGRCGISRTGFLRGIFYFFLDWQTLLEERVRVDYKKLIVFEPRQFAFRLKMPPGNVIVLPAEFAQRFECADLSDPRRPGVNPIRSRILQLGGERSVIGGRR